MTDYLDCYKAGERAEVWLELSVLGDRVLETRRLPDVLGVVNEAMAEAAAQISPMAQALGLVAHPLAGGEQYVALPVLLRLLGNPDSTILCFILATLTDALCDDTPSYEEASIVAAFAPVLALLTHGETKVRLGAVQALRAMGDKKAIAALTASLHDEDAGVRRAAVYALESLRAVDALIIALNDSDREVRRAAIYGLGEIKGYQAVKPILSRLYAAPDDTELTAIAFALGWLGGRQVVVANLSTDEANDLLRRLFAILEHETATAETREQVLTLIGMIAGAKIAGTLASELTSNNVSVRQSVLRGLVTTDSDEAVTLLQHIADSDTGERGFEARRALAEITHRKLYPQGW